MLLNDDPTNTTDLTNGLFVTINSTNKTFDYCDAYELLPQIHKVFYDVLGKQHYALEQHFALQPTPTLPSKETLDTTFINQNLFSVYSIGINRTGEKTHIHLWIYNLHSFSQSWKQFTKKLTSGLKKLNGISKRNEFGIKIIPSYDSIDRKIRKSNYDNQVLLDYVSNKEYDTLMHYFSTKNDKNFIYFY